MDCEMIFLNPCFAYSCSLIYLVFIKYLQEGIENVLPMLTLIFAGHGGLNKIILRLPL